MRVYYDRDADLNLIKSKKVVIVGMTFSRIAETFAMVLNVMAKAPMSANGWTPCATASRAARPPRTSPGRRSKRSPSRSTTSTTARSLTVAR